MNKLRGTKPLGEHQEYSILFFYDIFRGFGQELLKKNEVV